MYSVVQDLHIVSSSSSSSSPSSLSSPRMRIALTDYSSLEEVLRAVRDLPYEGGSRRTGYALRFLVDHVFGPVIRRDHVPKVPRVSTGEM